MPRAEVRQKIQANLERGIGQGDILYAGKVYPHPPKLTKASDLFEKAVPGEPGGAVIFMYLPTQSEYRIGIAGERVRGVPGSGGRKGRVYDLSLICYFVWEGGKATDADEANDAFIDSLTDWIELNRECGTQAVSLGGDGSGVIFCWGEGPDPSAIPGGKDIRVHTAFPRDIRGQSVQVFNMVDVSVIEILQT